MPALEWKHKLFADAFIKQGLRGVGEAAKVAKFSTNYATQILKRPEVQEYINSYKMATSLQRADDIRLADDVVRDTLTATPDRLFDDSGALLAPHEWDSDIKNSIKSVKIKTLKGRRDAEDLEIIEVTLGDKLKATDLMYKRHGVVADEASQNNVTNVITQININPIAPLNVSESDVDGLDKLVLNDDDDRGGIIDVLPD